MFHLFLRTPENIQQLPVCSYNSFDEALQDLIKQNHMYMGCEISYEDDCVFFFTQCELAVEYTLVVEGEHCKQAFPDCVTSWGPLECAEEVYDEVFARELLTEDDLLEDDDAEASEPFVAITQEGSMHYTPTPLHWSLINANLQPGHYNTSGILSGSSITFFTLMEKIQKNELTLLEASQMGMFEVYEKNKHRDSLTFGALMQYLKSSRAIWTDIYENGCFAYALPHDKPGSFSIQVDCTDFESEVLLSSYARYAQEETFRAQIRPLWLNEKFSEQIFLNVDVFTISNKAMTLPKSYSSAIRLDKILENIKTGVWAWHRYVDVGSVNRIAVNPHTRMYEFDVMDSAGVPRKIHVKGEPIKNSIATLFAMRALMSGNENNRNVAVSYFEKNVVHNIGMYSQMFSPTYYTCSDTASSYAVSKPYTPPAPKLSDSDKNALKPKPKTDAELEMEQVAIRDKMAGAFADLSDRSRKVSEKLSGLDPKVLPMRSAVPDWKPLGEPMYSITLPRWHFIFNRETMEHVDTIQTNNWASHNFVANGKYYSEVMFSPVSHWLAEGKELYGDKPDGLVTSNAGIAIQRNSKHIMVVVPFVDDLPSQFLFKLSPEVPTRMVDGMVSVDPVEYDADPEMTYRIARLEVKEYDGKGTPVYPTAKVASMAVKPKVRVESQPVVASTIPSYIDKFLKFCSNPA